MKKTAMVTISYCLWITNCLVAQPDTTKRFKLPADILNAKDIIVDKAPTNVQVVSASRSSKRMKDLPVTIHVVTQDEIRKNGYVTLVDVMKSVPGVRVSQPGSGLDGETFLFRGQIGNYYTKILVNNIPIQPSVAGGIALGAQLPIAQARQIEIIYGPASAVYGADAMTGVINIITDSPDGYSFTNADVALGQFGYKHINMITGGKMGKNKNILKYTLYANREQRDDLNVRHKKNIEFVAPLNNNLSYKGRVSSPVFNFLFRQRAEQLPAYVTTLKNNPQRILEEIRQENPDYQGDLTSATVSALPQESFLLGLKLEYRDLTFSYDNMFRSHHSSLGRAPDVFSYINSDSEIADKIQRFTLSYQHSWENFSFTSNVSYLKFELDQRSHFLLNNQNLTNNRAYTYEASDDVFFEALGSYPINDYLELTTGVSAMISGNLPAINSYSEPFDLNDYSAFRTAKREPHPVLGNFGDNPLLQNLIGYFAQLFYQRNTFTLIAGVRQDFSNQYNTSIRPNDFIGSLFPRVAILYSPATHWSFRASYGRAFKAPNSHLTFNSQAFEVRRADGSVDPNLIRYSRIPNEALEPEFITSYEAGIRYIPGKNINVDLNGYWSQIDQIITQTLVPLSNTPFVGNGISTIRRGNEYYVRMATNDPESLAALYGIQLAVRLQDLVPSLKLNADVYLNYAEGEEVLPTENNDRINIHRMVPKLMAQVNISCEPFKNGYLHLANIWMTDWVRRFSPDVISTRFRVPGYYNLDLIARYQLNKNASVFLKVKNVFDAEYGGIGALGLDIDTAYNPQLKRNIQFGASIQLK